MIVTQPDHYEVIILMDDGTARKYNVIAGDEQSAVDRVNQEVVEPHRTHRVIHHHKWSDTYLV